MADRGGRSGDEEEGPRGSGDPPIFQRALTRIHTEFAHVTDALIQAVFQHSREPTDALARRIEQLQRRRDELHERLEELEVRARAMKDPDRR